MNNLPAESIRSLRASDGYQLHFRHWRPIEEPLALVICLHGIQSHSGWYEYSSQQVAAAGFEVFFADRRGSGLNEATRGHADHADRLLNDVALLFDMAVRERPGLPVILSGISWGGKTAAAFCRKGVRPVDGLLLCYPGVCSRYQPSLWQRFLLWFARTHDIRHRLVDIPLKDPALFTDSDQWQEFIRTDALALRQMSSGLCLCGQQLDQAVRGPGQVLPRTLIALAGRDRIIDNSLTRRLFSSLESREMKFVEYPDAAHTLEFSGQRQQFVTDVVAWLRSFQQNPTVTS